AVRVPRRRARRLARRPDRASPGHLHAVPHPLRALVPRGRQRARPARPGSGRARDGAVVVVGGDRGDRGPQGSPRAGGRRTALAALRVPRARVPRPAPPRTATGPGPGPAVPAGTPRAGPAGASTPPPLRTVSAPPPPAAPPFPLRDPSPPVLRPVAPPAPAAY